MGRRRLAIGIVMASVGILIGVGSVLLGVLIATNMSYEVVIDEESFIELDENEYMGTVWYQSLSSTTRVRIRSNSDTEFDFTLVVRDPDGWVVKNHTDRTPFNRDLVFSTTLPGYYEFRLRILDDNVSFSEISFEILGTEMSVWASSGCTFMMCFGMGGGMLIFFGGALSISHFMGIYENEDRLKKQPESTPIELVKPVPMGAAGKTAPQTPPGFSRYQHAKQLELGGQYLEAMRAYQDLDLPLDAARCLSMHQNIR